MHNKEEEDKLKSELCTNFKLFKEKFHPIHVCSASENDVGLVTAAIGSKLLGERSLVLTANVLFVQKDSYAAKFNIQIVPNPHFETQIYGIYRDGTLRDMLRFMRDFSRQTLELEVKAFVLGLHALDELRERITNLEWEVKQLAKANKRDEKKLSYIGKAKR